jgi:UDPglucose 6-dehydrogenase
MTGILLASNNPQVQFTIVDTNERLIAAWKSDRPPITEPGIEDILFDDECLAIEGADNDTITAKMLASKSELEVRRRRKIQNLSFSSDVHATVASAQIVFLCVEMVRSTLVLDWFSLTHDIGRA